MRLDDKTREHIARIARRRRARASELIREAIRSYVEREESAASPYEAIADIIGIVHGGDPGRSSQAGRRITQLLKSRRDSGKTR